MFFPGSVPMEPVESLGQSLDRLLDQGRWQGQSGDDLGEEQGCRASDEEFRGQPGMDARVASLSDFGTDGHDLKAIRFAALAVPGNFQFLIDDVRLEPGTAARVVMATPYAAAQDLPDKRPFVLGNYKTVGPGMSTEPLFEAIT